MTYIPSPEDLKKFKFIKKRDTAIYERKISKDTTLYYDLAIEQEQKFYAVERDVEHLLEFEEKEEVLFFIETLKWEIEKLSLDNKKK